MSPDAPASRTAATTSASSSVAEARRQIEICNACRYCEGYCSVFPAMTRQKSFADSDITQLANLCHNCRGCYYACQYVEPHEFALNIPAVLAEVRQASWERLVGPQILSQAFHERGVAIAGAMVAGIAALFVLIGVIPDDEGDGFYAFLPHDLMVVIFLVAFGLPLASIAVAMRRYWAETIAARPRFGDIGRALCKAATLRNLDGGQGQGCNYENADRYSDCRRWFHQAVLYGFLACFASTIVATIMHYLLGRPAPYGLFSLPKLLGVPGGVLLFVGACGLSWLKTRADPALGAQRVWGGEMAFILLLAAVAATGLLLYAVAGTTAVPVLLALHLGSVLAFFLLLPYTKMVHGFFRIAALLAEEVHGRTS